MSDLAYEVGVEEGTLVGEQIRLKHHVTYIYYPAGEVWKSAGQ
jgi:hypothetical protein